MFIINRYHVLKPPELSVQVKNGGDVSVGDNVRLSITFTNTLPSSLTHTIFIVQGLGTCKEIPYRYVVHHQIFLVNITFNLKKMQEDSFTRATCYSGSSISG